MATLSDAQLAALVKAHWPDTINRQVNLPCRVVAFAIARAESGGRTDALGDFGNSYGLWQIDRQFHPQYSPSCLYDPNCNAAAAAAMSSQGSNFLPWCTYIPAACNGHGNNRFRDYIGAAQRALGASLPPPPPPPPPKPDSAISTAAILLLLAGTGVAGYALLRERQVSHDVADEKLYARETKVRERVGAGRNFASERQAERYAQEVLARQGSPYREKPAVRFSSKLGVSDSYLEGKGEKEHPVLDLGVGMRDQLTVDHELAHGITRLRTRNRQDPTGHAGHGPAFTKTFESVLQRELPSQAKALKATD